MMMQNALIWTVKAVALSVALCVLVPSNAEAQSRVKGEYANSKSPLHRVGKIDRNLSNLCRKGRFKQRRLLRLSIGFKGKKGYGITGVAQQGWNLYDPGRVAEPRKTYHFFNQGYSNCRVYVADTPRPRQARQ